MARDTQISVEELNRRLDQTARDLERFISESGRPERPVVTRDGDHVSVRFLPDKSRDK
ncbi:hypothetical protein L6Q96_11085 [Candidatus Binatia bacterium]|nr:hypothetical protein [Candidatus Binatia bacterium]